MLSTSTSNFGGTKDTTIANSCLTLRIERNLPNPTHISRKPRRAFSLEHNEPEVEPLIKGSYCVHAELCILELVQEEFLRAIENNQKGAQSRGALLPVFI